MKETEFINSFNHPVLQYVGGKIFPEMETPKLLWLKKNLKDTWNKAGYFFDLPDFLTWRATGNDSRLILKPRLGFNFLSKCISIGLHVL